MSQHKHSSGSVTLKKRSQAENVDPNRNKNLFIDVQLTDHAMTSRNLTSMAASISLKKKF